MAMPTVSVRSPKGHWAPGYVRQFWTSAGTLRALVLVSRWDRFGDSLDGVQSVPVTHLAAVAGQDYTTVPGAPEGVTDMLAPPVRQTWADAAPVTP